MRMCNEKIQQVWATNLQSKFYIRTFFIYVYIDSLVFIKVSIIFQSLLFMELIT